MSSAKFAQPLFFLFVGLAALLVVRPAQAQTETVLYNFTGSPYDIGPTSSLTSDGAGNFYGTTAGEGLGWGTVFELSPNHGGGWNGTTIYSFTGGVNGWRPFYSNVIFDSLGNIYGTTEEGGANGYGVVFKLSRVGSSWTETVLHNFAASDGYYPLAGLIMDSAGNLYGTTYGGGSTGGCVFELSSSGGNWTEQVIYAVEPAANGMTAGLTMDAAGNIFGASYSTVFELSPNGRGGWNPTVIHTFDRNPKDDIVQGTLALDNTGSLYGTTAATGTTRAYFDGRGTVYKLTPKMNGKWAYEILHSFGGDAGYSGGVGPFAGVVLDSAGNIYGTTVGGGTNTGGTVFELVAPVGKGSYDEKVLWNFGGDTDTDGNTPYGGVILDSAGNVYGTTAYGGTGGGDGLTGYGGIAFEVSP